MSVKQQTTEMREMWVALDGELLPLVTALMDILMGRDEGFDSFEEVDRLVSSLQTGLHGYERLLDRLQSFVDALRQALSTAAAPFTRPHPLACSQWELLEIADVAFEAMLDDYQAKHAVLSTLFSGVVPSAAQRLNYEALWRLHPLLNRPTAVDAVRNRLSLHEAFSSASTSSSSPSR
ncbi:MAG: hypothetical protein Q8P67_15270 [archaeon]|nr:hypothetical protein [archaeon]